MPLSRKEFLARTSTLICLPFGAGISFKDDTSKPQQDLPTWPVPELSRVITSPVTIRKVELLKTQGELMLVVTSDDGRKGFTQCNDRMQHLTSLLKGLVIPHFVNQDARELPVLADNAYRKNSNYKYAGMPLWNCIGSVEIAVWDLLGRVAERPAYALLGKQARSEYDVYISDWNRSGDPEKIAEQLLEKLEYTGARGVKVKVGGRMQNTAADTEQTKRFIPVLRKRLGDDVTIYADANGSYTAKEGVDTGRFLEDHGIAIFEEPCNFEDEEGMKSVTDSLRKLKVAGGEQDSSVYRFRRLAQQRIYDVLQPDLYYNGGILRTLQVAEIARVYRAVGVAPHTPKADPLIAPFWQVAALIPNLFGLQEFVYNPGRDAPDWFSKIEVNKGKVKIPSAVGLGIEYDDAIWHSAEKVV